MINITDFLSVGKKGARTAKELAEITGINDIRTIADIIHNTKVKGEIICACSQGYYLPSGRNDVLQFYRRTISRVNKINKTLPPMEDYLKCTD